MAKEHEALVSKVESALLPHAEEGFAKGVDRYFKNQEVKALGIRTKFVRLVAKELFPEVKDLSIDKIFEVSETLLQKGYSEYRVVALDWLYRSRKYIYPNNFKSIEKLFDTYVKNWADCDDFCVNALGPLLLKYPELTPKIKAWAKNKNRWMRRASMVAQIIPIRKKQIGLEHIFETAKVLFADRDDMVEKGVGWTLKESWEKFPEETIQFVTKHKSKMGRVMLRIALEKVEKLEKMKILG